jgi:hypothetical protein
MILTAQELRQYVTTDEEDQALEAKLSALELLIRAHTHNNFQQRTVRSMADIFNGTLVMASNPFKVGDTVQVTESNFNDGLYTVTAVDDSTATLKEETVNEDFMYATKVVYPMDVKMGVVNLMKWDMNNRDKVGIASETISRHSVTYESMTDDNSIMGYPKSLMGFLKPYMKARFGQGVRV